jgi:cytosine deaminase
MSITLPQPLSALRNATLPNGELVDVSIADGIVTAVTPAAGETAPIAASELDLAGMLLLTAGAEPHTHVDKSLVFDTIQPTYGDLANGIRQWQEYAVTIDESDFIRRGFAMMKEFLANGITAVRTHAEIFPMTNPLDDPLKSVRAMIHVRDALKDVMDIQVAVMPKNNISVEIIRQAIEEGADLVGGSPHNTDDPAAELARLLAIAHETGVGIDIHADERLDPTSLTVWALAKHVLEHPLKGTVTAGHCVSLGLLERPLLDEIAADIAAAGIGVVAAPVTNLYLQGRMHPVATPRGITAVRALLENGVLVAGAGDNVRDTLNPVGAADAFATASLLVAAAHLTIEEAYTAVSDSARAVMGLRPAGAFVGGAAEFVAVDSPTLSAAVAGTAFNRIVIHRGRVVSRRSSTLESAIA